MTGSNLPCEAFSFRLTANLFRISISSLFMFISFNLLFSFYIRAFSSKLYSEIGKLTYWHEQSGNYSSLLTLLQFRTLYPGHYAGIVRLGRIKRQFNDLFLAVIVIIAYVNPVIRIHVNVQRK